MDLYLKIARKISFKDKENNSCNFPKQTHTIYVNKHRRLTMRKKIYLDSPDERLVTTQLSLVMVNPKSVYIEISDRTKGDTLNREFAIFMGKEVRFCYRFVCTQNVWTCGDMTYYYPLSTSKALTEKQEQKLFEIIKPLVIEQMNKKENILLAMEAGILQQGHILYTNEQDMKFYETKYQDSVKKHQAQALHLTFMQQAVAKFKQENNL